jgi:hypothetical protein
MGRGIVGRIVRKPDVPTQAGAAGPAWSRFVFEHFSVLSVSSVLKAFSGGGEVLNTENTEGTERPCFTRGARCGGS